MVSFSLRQRIFYLLLRDPAPVSFHLSQFGAIYGLDVRLVFQNHRSVCCGFRLFRPARDAFVRHVPFLSWLRNRREWWRFWQPHPRDFLLTLGSIPQLFMRL